MKKVFVNGDFNVLHPGHIRLLKFAKESGDYLVVGVNCDAISSKSVSEDIRLESIQATSYVDESFILRTSALEYIKENKPDIVVKGKEHELKENVELDVVRSYGGQLIFSSGEIGFSSMDLLRREFLSLSNNVNHNTKYTKRHDIELESLKRIIEKFHDLKVLVVGDTIVDEYITCEPLGMSQEDPTIVVSPLATNKFIGGAAIVASHARTLGADVKFISVVGDDENNHYVQEGLSALNIETSLFYDTTRPTTLKQRFRASNKTLLRVNHVKQHYVSKDIENEILSNVRECIDEMDLIIFSDFSYGVLTDNIIEGIVALGEQKNIFMAADSQSSSQNGDITKFKGMDLVTPTEREIRLSLNDFSSGLVILSEKLSAKSSPKYIFTTLGAEGLMIYNSVEDKLLTDNVEALGSIIKDVSGAGDSLLTSSSMALAVGADIWQSAYIGSLCAAIQVSRVGNIPITKKEILDELD